MTDFHVAEVRRLVPSVGEKVHRLESGADIPDPMGGDVETYRHAAHRISKAVAERLSKELK